MATLNYWDKADSAWKPIGTGGSGGGAPGPAGPAGKDGESVNVFGPQIAQPIPERKGDMWLAEAVLAKEVPDAEPLSPHPGYEAPSLAEPALYEVASLVEPPAPSPYPTLKE